MADKHLKTNSVSLIKGTQMETTSRFHLIPTCRPKINRTSDRFADQRMVPCAHPALVPVQTHPATMARGGSPREVGLTYSDPAILLLSYTKDTVLPERHLLSHVQCCYSHNSQILEIIQISLNSKQIRKMEQYSDVKEITLGEVTQKDKYGLYSCICGYQSLSH